jgi:hypothetical protein
MPRFKVKALFSSQDNQCEQIGRISAQWVIVYFGRIYHAFLSYFIPWLSLFINFDTKWVGIHFGRFFSHTHLVTLQDIIVLASRIGFNAGIFWLPPTHFLCSFSTSCHHSIAGMCVVLYFPAEKVYFPKCNQMQFKCVKIM